MQNNDSQSDKVIWQGLAYNGVAMFAGRNILCLLATVGALNTQQILADSEGGSHLFGRCPQVRINYPVCLDV